MSFDENSFLTGIVVGSAIRRRPKSQELPQALIFAGEGAFTLSITNAEKNWDGTLEYCRDLVHWNEWDGTTAISSGAHDLLLLRGYGNTVITGAVQRGFVISGSNVACRGSIEYLLDADEVAAGRHPEMGACAFQNLFRGCTGLTEAPEFPAVVLSEYCYSGAFSNCTGLTEAPALPATTLAEYCYLSMFRGCTGITKAPELPATTLAHYCYAQMFYGCTSLKDPSEFHATTLAPSCCYLMYFGCTALDVLPTIYADTTEDYCFFGMFEGCIKLRLSSTKTGEYDTSYVVRSLHPFGYLSVERMFSDTGGTFTGTPAINAIYYTSNEVIS